VRLLDRTATILGSFLLLVAGALVSIAVTSVPIGYVILSGALVVSVYVSVVVIGRLNARLRQGESADDDRLAVQTVYDDSEAAKRDLYAAIQAAKSAVTLLGISHRSLLSDDKFLEAIDAFLANRNARLVILFAHPASDDLAQRAIDEGDEPETFASDVRTNRRRFEVWATRHAYKSCIEIRYYRGYPTWRIEAIDDQELFVSCYPEGSTGQHSVVLRLVRSGRQGSLFDAFANQLARIARASTVAPTDTANLELPKAE